MQSSGELKKWMVVVAGICLATGIALGVAMPSVYAKVFPDFDNSIPISILQMQEQYGLTEDQVRLMRSVLADKNAQIMAFIKTGVQLPPEVRAGIKRISRQADDRLEAVLDSRQRALYREDKQLEPSRPERHQLEKKK